MSLRKSASENPIKRLDRMPRTGQPIYFDLKTIVQIYHLLCFSKIILCLALYSSEKKQAPSCPVVISRNGQQPFIIIFPMFFKVGAYVEPRFSNYLSLP